MKIECSCGAKYEFEVLQEMRTRPVQFECPACGRDSSAFVDSLIRRQFDQSGSPEGEPILINAVSRQKTVPPMARVLETREGGPLSRPGPEENQVEEHPQQSVQLCSRHAGQVATEKCFICSKPICPKCMELFGYVCSPLCKAKAGSHGVKIPVYQGQNSVREALRWRKLAWAGTLTGAALAGALALWFWYAWFGCAPKVIFSIRFPEPAYSGQSVLAGTARNQIVFLHGGTLARYELKSGNKIWQREILAREEMEHLAQSQLREERGLIDRAKREGWEHVPGIQSQEELIESLQREAAAALSLHVRGQNIWVASPEKLVRYSWETGEESKVLPIQSSLGEPIWRGDELLLVTMASGKAAVTRVNLTSGESRTQDLADADPALMTATRTRDAAAVPTTKAQAPARSSLSNGKDAKTTIDPAKIATQSERMSFAEKEALPATLAVKMNQQRALNEMDDEAKTPKPVSTAIAPGSGFSLIPTTDGFVEFGVKLLEARVVARSAMKPASGKSALDGEVTAGKSMDLANDMLNEMQRSNGGDMVEEDQSRYQVTVRRPGTDAVWTSEVVGPPRLYPLENVTVLACNKMIIVLNRANQKLWQSTLAYNLPQDLNALDEESATYGRGPCVEHQGSLYVFDEGVLSAFELATGNARWRLPSVGVAGLFFDDRDMLYVNTTSASHDRLKYSRQIDLSSKARTLILKVDSHNGKILWTEPSRGLVNYVSGKFILTAASFMPREPEPGEPETERHPWLRIKRIRPSDGREVWDHFQERAPLDLAFDKNTIRLVFKKEVQVLRFPGF